MNLPVTRIWSQRHEILLFERRRARAYGKGHGIVKQWEEAGEYADQLAAGAFY